MSSVTGDLIKSNKAGSCSNLGMSDAGCLRRSEGGMMGDWIEEVEAIEEAERERSMFIFANVSDESGGMQGLDQFKFDFGVE